MMSCFIVRKCIKCIKCIIVCYLLWSTWCVGTIVNIYLVEEKKCALLIVLVKVKNNILPCRPLASADPQTSIGRSSWQLKYGCDPLVSIWISAGIRIPMVIQKSTAKLTPRQIHSCLLKLGLNIIYTSIFPLMGKIAKQWNIIFMKSSGSVKCEAQSLQFLSFQISILITHNFHVKIFSLTSYTDLMFKQTGEAKLVFSFKKLDYNLQCASGTTIIIIPAHETYRQKITKLTLTFFGKNCDLTQLVLSSTNITAFSLMLWHYTLHS